MVWVDCALLLRLILFLFQKSRVYKQLEMLLLKFFLFSVSLDVDFIVCVFITAKNMIYIRKS
jgi:hypothetical protein